MTKVTFKMKWVWKTLNILFWTLFIGGMIVGLGSTELARIKEKEEKAANRQAMLEQQLVQHENAKLDARKRLQFIEDNCHPTGNVTVKLGTLDPPVLIYDCSDEDIKVLQRLYAPTEH